jgi:hypothetical protein
MLRGMLPVPIHVGRDSRHQWLLAAATGVITIEMVLELLRTARARRWSAA